MIRLIFISQSPDIEDPDIDVIMGVCHNGVFTFKFYITVWEDMPCELFVQSGNKKRVNIEGLLHIVYFHSMIRFIADNFDRLYSTAYDSPKM